MSNWIDVASVSESIGYIPDKFPGYNFQSGELKVTKELFPAYKEIHAEVQQQISSV
jgi:hypothetical protein